MSLASARQLFETLAARDGREISSAGRSRLIASEAPARIAVVLVHGFTNCPEQWMPFARDLAADGCSVVIPRLPGHGFADRTTKAIGRVRAGQLLDRVSDALDIAACLSDRVVIAGLSIGASLAIKLALERADVATAVAIVPFIGIKHLNAAANAFVASSLTTLPDLSVPWDPSGKNASIPPYGYTHFPTRVLGECLHVGIDCYDLARTAVPRGNIHFLLNANEPACNNELSLEIARRFEVDRPRSTRITILDGLPANHDIIDVTNPDQRVSLVYPRLRELVEN